MALEEQAMLELLPHWPAGACWTWPAAAAAICAAGWRGRRALGLDLSPAMLARAAALGRPLAQADLLQLPLAAGRLGPGRVRAGGGTTWPTWRAVSWARWRECWPPAACVVYSDLHPFGALAGLEAQLPRP